MGEKICPLTRKECVAHCGPDDCYIERNSPIVEQNADNLIKTNSEFLSDIPGLTRTEESLLAKQLASNAKRNLKKFR